MRKSVSDELGKFFMVRKEGQFSELAPETVTKLIYLTTFMGYSDSRLMLSQRTYMKLKDLPTVLGVSKATAYRFFNEVSPKYIEKLHDDTLLVNKNIFVRGKLKQYKGYPTYERFFIKGVRTLYEIIPTNKHKQLGYLFKLLPFVNIEFNLLCLNPLETELENIELISIADFCELIGFDVKHVNSLLRVYNSLYFNVNGRKEKFCAITYDGINKKNAKIFINPHILYSGTNYQQVKVLGAFCKK